MDIIPIKIEEKVAHYNSPRSGFHFIVPDQLDQLLLLLLLHINPGPKVKQWSLRYWFPCIDDPQVKFTREIEVIAPDDEYLVISNGTYERKGNIWKWNRIDS